MARRRSLRASIALLSLTALAAPALHAAEVNATLGIDNSHLAGTDAAGRVLLFTPNLLQTGSSVSHWDSMAFPNLLMEPVASSSLGFGQLDLTPAQLQDIGWPRGTSNVVLRYTDPAGQGFDDPTLGAQRRAAIEFVADRWGSLLASSVTVNVEVRFQDLTCDETGGILAQAGPQFLFESFAGAPVPGTWYPGALAESLSGQNLSLEDVADPNAGDLAMTFNSRIDQSCLGAGSSFYYGLDGNVPSGGISFVNVALHEAAHGLGFVSFVDESTGVQFLGKPDIYGRFTFDNDLGRHWHQMSNAERRSSAVNDGRVAWSGGRVTAQAPNFLQPGPALEINSPASIAGFYRIGTANFGPPLANPGVTADVAAARDASAQPTLACGPLANPGEVAGKIALIDRGECNFTVKVRNAQDAGAVAVIIANNVAGTPPNMAGDDPTITIPSVSVTRDAGQRIRAALAAVDPAGSLQFASAAFAAGEGDGNAVVTVTRDGGTAGEVSVSYSTTDGTATAGEDYLPTSGTLTFADGEGGSQSFAVPIVDDEVSEDAETVSLSLSDPTGGASLGQPSSAVLTIGDNEVCIADGTTLCLNGGRFRVRVGWRDFEDRTGDGRTVPFGSDDSGLFWFFAPDNWEMLIKVIDGCAFNDRVWVFAAATTNVEYTLRVTDTVTGQTKEYMNLLGNRAPAITDTRGFDACP
jgi:hypothetical protein